MKVDVVIVGGGIAGLTAALVLAQKGLDVVVLDRVPLDPATDKRTSGLWRASIKLLDEIGIWPDIKNRSQPIEALKIIDGVTATFQAHEIGEKYLGFNVVNATLRETLIHKLETFQNVQIQAPVEITALNKGEIHIKNSQSIRAKLVIGADGIHSVCRKMAGIQAKTWDYGQDAIVCMLTHEKPHHNTSIEVYTPAGPFTMVPLAGDQSSLVWVEKRAEAARILQLAPEKINERMFEKSKGVLGQLTAATQRVSYPLKGLHAQTYVGERLLLMGEAAHKIHPIGAQGLNLSLRDVQEIHRLFTKQNIGDSQVLRRYNRLRKLDTTLRVNASDQLSKIVSNDNALVAGFRQFGLRTLNALPGLKKMLIKAGIAS